MAHFPHLFILLILTTPFVSSKKWAEDRAVVARSDFQALKSIKRELVDPLGALSTWNSSGLFGPCSDWAGIKCSRGRVVSIQLPWRSLAGRISDEVGQLQSLRRLSLHDNSLAGPLPISLTLLRNLRGLYLFNNRLSGSIPASIGNCLNLQALDLSNNRINGSVPSSIGELTRVYRVNLSRNSIVGGLPYELGDLSNLVFLDLSSNGFDGRIPDSIGDITSLASLDLSRNNLSGSVPFALTEKFNASSFLGNKNLCGYSISTECPSQIAPSPSQPTESTTTIIRSRKLSTKDVILIASGALLLVLLVTCCVLLFCLIRRKRAFSKGKSGNSKAAPAVVVGPDSDSGQEMGGKLVHFDGPFVFTADDLLCATAEIMGKSTYGTAYKATLEEGNNNNNNNNNLVAVKRLKEKISKARKEFEIEIARLGKIRHSNILALRAYYLGPKGEKLLVYDYMPNGSLASFLHARGPETIIPWSTRLSVAIGTTRGLCYLHDHENTIHGNLTSSNVLLDEQTGPKIADVGLSRLMTDTANTDAVATAGTLGYRAPELTRLKNATTKSDVYSLGVIFLELLSGKSPSEADEGCDLPRWVASIVKEEWTNEVFDVELMRGVSGIGDELLNVLKLALHCVDPSPAARPEAREILEKLEEVRPGPSQSPIEVVTTPAASVDGGKQG